MVTLLPEEEKFSAYNATEALSLVFDELHRHGQSKANIRAHLIEINRLEDESDALLCEALSRLFNEERLSPVEGVAGKIVLAWVLTLPSTALLAGLLARLVSALRLHA